ncbi:MAG: hypothetical protein AAF518_07875 [Spirochaetota bacterium]
MILNRRLYTYSLLLCVLALSLCRPANTKIPAFNAQSQINAAADFKAKECNQDVPQPPLYVFADQEQRNVDLCSIAITRLKCPFGGYPIICFGLYTSSPTPEIPWYLNFNALTDERFKF